MTQMYYFFWGNYMDIYFMELRKRMNLHKTHFPFKTAEKEIKYNFFFKNPQIGTNVLFFLGEMGWIFIHEIAKTHEFSHMSYFFLGE